MIENHTQLTADEQHMIETFKALPPTRMKILAIAGQAGSGKDTVADLLQPHLAEFAIYRTAFAQQLKAMLAAAGYPCPDTLEGKQKVIPELGVSWRHMAQQLGGRWRDSVNPQIFVIGTMQRLQEAEKNGIAIAIVTDVRYQHEVDALRRLDAQLLHVVGPDNGMTHESEQKLPIQHDDLVLSNVSRHRDSMAVLETEVQHLADILKMRWKL